MAFVVVHESMFGNTRMVAEVIADALRADGAEVRELPAARLLDFAFGIGDVLVIGAPTHAHTLPGKRSRVVARDMARKSDPPLTLELTAAMNGVREWLDAGVALPAQAAVFDTRAKGPRLLTGSAAVRIARQLRRRRVHVLVPPASFFVGRNRLLDGEVDRAKRWAQSIAAQRSMVPEGVDPVSGPSPLSG